MVFAFYRHAYNLIYPFGLAALYDNRCLGCRWSPQLPSQRPDCVRSGSHQSSRTI